MKDFKQITIYNYDPTTKEFTSAGLSERNPLDPETPIIPSCATTIVPLEIKSGYAIVWVGNKWQYREDHRGESWYNSKTKNIEVIDFIGTLPSNYYTLDSAIVNKPDGDYWDFDSDLQEWVGNSTKYKLYVLNNFNSYWEIKQNTPFTFENHQYLPEWRDLYNSIYSTLKDGIKTEYRLQDYNGEYINVTLTTMKPIYAKMADVVDQMYRDKQDLEAYFKVENDFNKLQAKFQEWIKKSYD